MAPTIVDSIAGLFAFIPGVPTEGGLSEEGEGREKVQDTTVEFILVVVRFRETVLACHVTVSGSNMLPWNAVQIQGSYTILH